MPHSSEIVSREKPGPLGFYAPPEIHVECDAFRGSLATLFECVREQKIELLGVPLAPICEAYFAYLLENAEHDLESAAVALAALSYLLERKAWLLLPNASDEPEGDEVLEAILPYIDEFKPAITALRELKESRESVFFRSLNGSGDAFEMPLDSSSVTIDALGKALVRLLERARPDLNGSLTQDRRTLSEQMVVVMQALPAEFASLDEIVVGDFTRSDVVWWFLALLELIRLGQAVVKLRKGEALFRKEIRS